MTEIAHTPWDIYLRGAPRDIRIPGLVGRGLVGACDSEVVFAFGGLSAQSALRQCEIDRCKESGSWRYLALDIRLIPPKMPPASFGRPANVPAASRMKPHVLEAQSAYYLYRLADRIRCGNGCRRKQLDQGKLEKSGAAWRRSSKELSPATRCSMGAAAPHFDPLKSHITI
jgi:hypothetical protein